METSNHNHDIEGWPFDCEQNQLAITTKWIMDESKPILAVLHDEEGEWQILCDTTNDPEDGMVVCMGCLFNKFPLIGQFSSLKLGWEAYRKNETDSWKIGEIDWG